MDVQTIQKLKIDHTKLAAARKEKGMSQADAGRGIGVDRRSIWQYEQGNVLPLENFTKLMLLYEKDIHYFLATE